MKNRRPITTKSKRPSAPKVSPRRNPSNASANTKTALLTRERDEALEREKATANVLRVISSSSGDVGPIFKAMLENATRICEAQSAVLWLSEQDGLRQVASRGVPVAAVNARRGEPLVKPHPDIPLGRAVQTKKTVHVADLKKDKSYIERIFPVPILVDQGGARTILNVPMVKHGELIGIINLYRKQVWPFTDKQIELVQNFAAQAVIAIENTRLLNELRQRTDDLTESLEQQTATSEVLQVISRSPGDLQPVFQAMLVNATRICGAKLGALYLCEADRFRLAATCGVDPTLEVKMLGQRVRPAPNTVLGRLMRFKEKAHIVDAFEEQGFFDAPAGFDGPQLALHAGARTLLGVPLLKDNELVGGILIFRQEVRPFTERQIALVQNFAAQAVIAIENTRLLNELRESLQQQTATAEVLKVISRSTFDLRTVLDALVESAAQLCEAEIVVINRLEERFYRVAASFGITSEQREAIANIPIESGRSTITGRAALGRQIVHIADVRADPEFTMKGWYEKVGSRTMLGVPLLREGIPIGVMVLMRRVVRPFTDSQIALVATFADQAVIAIENVRLFEAEQQRTRELSEALEQQTATSEVLKVISSSPGELEPVFQAMLENATRICEASFGNLLLREGDAFRAVALHNAPPAYIEERKRNPLIWPDAKGGIGRLAATKQVVHIVDLQASQAYREGITSTVLLVDSAGARTYLAIPMLNDDVLIGAIIIYRQEVRPFTDKQIALLQNFAAQAVIAIENTRLLNELRQRTMDLTESLEQQTATSEVLRVISSSPNDLGPVFQSILQNAVHICDANFGTLSLYEGDAFRMVATHNVPPAFAELRRRQPLFRPRVMMRMAETKQVLHIADTAQYAASEPVDPDTSAFATLSEVRTVIAVPMLKDDNVIGAIVIYRKEVKGFTDRQIELIKHFAGQAVIAIENTRLLNELRESLEQQTATAEVLSVISSSPGELEPVFETLLANAVRICGAKFGMLFLPEGDDGYRIVALHGAPPAFAESRRREPVISLNPATTLGRVAATKQVVQVEDIRADPAYTGDPTRSSLLDLSGARTMLNVPMLKDDELVGQIAIYRQEVRPFTDKQTALVQNFAAQAVIAIENTRLLSELRQRTEDLSKSLDDLRTAQDRLVQTQKLASLGQLTAGIAHEIKNPLNFVNNFSGVSVELIDELQETLGRVTTDDKTRGEIAELAGTLRDNLGKIVQHGKRADSIVKNMLLHSREGSGERRSVDVNAIVEESINLAYHGARAEKQGFNITLERSFDPAAGEVDVYPQEITRVLLNLISNGFYAATKRQGQERGNGFEPTITAATKSLGDRVEIRIRDNGTGIPPEVREKMFNPFYTTKPAGEGTGLGLSISHDIIVKQHSGFIEVDTEPGLFTEFRIILPRSAA